MGMRSYNIYESCGCHHRFSVCALSVSVAGCCDAVQLLRTLWQRLLSLGYGSPHDIAVILWIRLSNAPAQSEFARVLTKTWQPRQVHHPSLSACLVFSNRAGTRTCTCKSVKLRMEIVKLEDVVIFHAPQNRYHGVLTGETQKMQQRGQSIERKKCWS